jgi:hypothetical protein
MVATWHNLIVLHKGEVLENLSEPNTGHYGITWNDRYLFALFADATVMDGTNQVIRLFDHNLKPVRDILQGVIAGVHQIIWYDGLLWVCSTNDDSIVVSTENGEVVQRWHPAPDFDPDDPAKDHINSIWFDHGYVYVVAHGFHHGTPAIHKFSYPEFQPVGNYPSVKNGHNVYVDDGNLLTCMPHGLYIHGGEPVRLDGGMTKGLSVTADRIYAGASSIIKDRERRRKDRRGRIFILNRGYDWLDTIDLELGPVGEVRVLDVPDLAHHSRPWGGKYGA